MYRTCDLSEQAGHEQQLGVTVRRKQNIVVAKPPTQTLRVHVRIPET